MLYGIRKLIYYTHAPYMFSRYLRIFNLKGTALDETPCERFLLEKELQRITETNLKTLFGLDLVKSEFELKGVY